MSLPRCITKLLTDKTITPEQAKRAKALFDEIEDELRRIMGRDAAAATASARTVKALMFDAVEQKRRALLTVAADRRMDNWMRGGGEAWGRGARDLGAAANAAIPGERSEGALKPEAGRRLLVLTEARRQAIEARAFAHMTDILADHTRSVTGKVRNAAELDEIGKAAYGEATDSLAARELAQSYEAAHEMLRLRGNAAGASIAKPERWGLPQGDASRTVAETGFDAWFADKQQWVGRSKMIDFQTGEAFTDARFEAVARDVFRTEASGGAADMMPGGAGKASLATQLSQQRFWIYKDYASWKANHEKYGSGTVLDAMIGDIRRKARSVAAMEMLGPNPDRGARRLADVVTGDHSLFEQGQLRARDRSHKEAVAIERLWDEYSGALRQPESRAMALGFGAYRSVAASAKLGGAFLTATGDMGFGMATRHFNGLPQARLLRDYLKLFNPADDSHRRLASRLGFVPETWTSIHASQSRFLAEEVSGEVASRVTETVLRASGLNAITDAGRGANGLVWLTHITNERGKGFDALEPAFRSALHRYRIGAKEWDAIRATPLEEDGGAEWIKPQNVKDQELGDRIFELAYSEGDFAVPVPGIETRAYIDSQWRKGTFLGELIRSSPLMFKTFTVSMMIRHGGRMLDQPGIGGKLGYLVSVLAPVTLMGAMAVQLKEIAKGRDPRQMDDPSFWGHAMVMGGGAGIVGDLLGLTGENRYGGWDEYAAGPLVSDVGRLAGAATGIGKNALLDAGVLDPEAHHRAGHPAWDLARVIREQVPGNNIWYGRLVIDRLLADQLQAAIDPQYHMSRGMVVKRAREAGQGLWWMPGDLAPDRAPDVANVLGAAAPE